MPNEDKYFINIHTMKSEIVKVVGTLTDQLAGLRHDRDDINARIKEKIVELSEATKLHKALTRTRRTK
jgi:hypothetical protein